MRCYSRIYRYFLVFQRSFLVLLSLNYRKVKKHSFSDKNRRKESLGEIETEFENILV